MGLAKSQIQVIHVAKAKCGMSEEDYRALLGSVGAQSSKDLGRAQFDEIMRHFETLGFRSTGAARIRRVQESRRPLMEKIGALLTAQGLPWSYADGIAKRMFKVQRCEWCDPQRLLKIVAALSYRNRKHGEEGS
ncbi:phage protein GemA/Gp16 family protein [Mycolicibacterium sp.]|uniref:phage protein GemA/Gp16 family protein n=1 Tax=Mycolicibacterium sp. TaxID=2320850 RepID=UPI00356071F3